jgi:GTP cyclohydrolase IV
VRVGLRASVMTACPCTQAFSWYSTVLSLADRFGVDVANEVGKHILGHTHSQRGHLEVEIECDHADGLEWIYSAMAAGAHLTHDLLKRSDEHELVERAHQRPQFTEDVVRAVTARLLRASAPMLRSDSEIRVSCRNVESIHSHDVHSAVRGTVADLEAAIAGSMSERHRA